ncbi:hypothetical protein Tco_1103427 [Tanacetum coccineum]
MPVMPPPSSYEVGGSSTAAAEGHSLTLFAPGVLVLPSVNEDLCTRMGNLEYGHRQLVKKVITVSDAEVADSIAIREIGPRVSTVEGQMHVMASQMVQVVNGLEQVRTHVEQGSGSKHFEIIMIGCSGLGTEDCNSWRNFGYVVALFLRWVEAKVVSSKVESEKWRRLLLHQMCVANDVATDGREEDFLP